jgi:hypothetical protein
MTNRHTFLHSLRILVAAVVVAGTAVVSAAPINHGNFVGSNVTYSNVTENSLTDTPPLFGAPTVSGDSLDFSPIGFFSTSTNGSSDITDGALTTMVMSNSGKGIPGIEIDTAGDFALVGLGGAATSASDALSVFVDILEVDGKALGAPINLNGKASASKNLLADGPGPFVGGIWDATVSFANLNAILTANSIAYVNGVTKLSITLDNSLATGSEAGTSALIGKKDFEIRIVPEPSSVVMAGLGIAALVLARRRG